MDLAVLGVWIAAFCTLAVYSFLYGDNPVFKFAEHAFVGLAAAHVAVMGIENMRNRAWEPFVAGQWWLLGALIGGVMLLTRWFPSVRWISRIPLGFMMGVAAGMAARRAIESEFWKQIISTAGMKLDTLDNVLYLVIVLCTLSYFLFAFNDRTRFGGAIKSVGVVGQYVMMIAFGASLGATIMARLSLVIARLDFLFRNWLHLLD